MKISIAMATYNGARYLPAQLDSFARQTRPPYELIAADDGSIDSSALIIEQFGKHVDFHVHLLSGGARLGPKDNFARALSACSGDLVLLSDQDDVWLPEKIAVLSDAASIHPNKACFVCDTYMADGDLRPTGTTKMQQIQAAGLPPQAMVMGCCTAIRRDLLNALLPIPPTQRAHDNWLVGMADLLELAVRIPTPLQYYRRHGGNVSDYFVNRLDRPGPWGRLSGRIRELIHRATRGDGLVRECNDLADAADRLALRADTFQALIGERNFARVQAALGRRLAHLSERQRIRSLPQASRIGAAARYWLKGGYLGNGGVTAVLKDLTIRADHGGVR